MILFSIGVSSRFAEWCDAVLMRLAGIAGGEVVLRSWPPLDEMFGYETSAPALDELGRVLIGNDAEHMVIGVRQPDATLHRALAEHNTRLVVALDDPRNAVADIVAQTGAELKTVVRAVANCCPLIAQAYTLPGALNMQAARARSDPAGAIAAIAAHFGIDVGGDTVQAIAAEMATPDGWMTPAGDALAASLPQPARTMFDGALLGYRDLFLDGRLGQVIWSRDLFLFTGGTGLNEPIDIAGGRRILVFGPYIHLPGGSWTAQVVLGFSREAANYTFLVDAYADGELAATTFRPQIPGVYHAGLAFALSEPSGKGVEVRLTTLDNDGCGQLAFGQVVLSPVTVHHAEVALPAGEDFTMVLGL